MKNQVNLSQVNWNSYVDEMQIRFSESEYSDHMFELVSLKHVTTVDEYYEEFESMLNLLQLSDEYALGIFISNLKPEISKPVRLFHPKTLNHALTLAKQLENMLFNVPKRTYLPKNPFIYSSQ